MRQSWATKEERGLGSRIFEALSIMDNLPPVAEPREAPDATRRSFFVGAVHGLWALMAAALGAPAIAYLLLPAKIRRGSEWIEAGSIRGLMPNVPTEITFRRNRVDGWRVTSEKSTAWVVKVSDTNVIAFAPQCTHLGCVYHWEQNQAEFVCPCHNSLFSIDGEVKGGPAPRPLDRYQTKVEAGQLLLGPVQPSPSQPV